MEFWGPHLSCKTSRAPGSEEQRLYSQATPSKTQPMDKTMLCTSQLYPRPANPYGQWGFYGAIGGANRLILQSFLALVPRKSPKIYSYTALSPGWGVTMGSDYHQWHEAFMMAVTFNANWRSLKGNSTTPSWKINNLDSINLFYSKLF